MSYFSILIRRILMVVNVLLLGVGIAALFIDQIKIVGAVTLSAALVLTLSKTGLYERLIGDLNKSIANIEFQTKRFSDENDKLNGAISGLRAANTQLLEIQKQSQNLLTSLMTTGDKFSDFGKILEETVDKNLTLADKLKILVSGLTEAEFKKMDLNNDGVITKSEMDLYFSLNK